MPKSVTNSSPPTNGATVPKLNPPPSPLGNEGLADSGSSNSRRASRNKWRKEAPAETTPQPFHHHQQQQQEQIKDFISIATDKNDGNDDDVVDDEADENEKRVHLEKLSFASEKNSNNAFVSCS